MGKDDGFLYNTLEGIEDHLVGFIFLGGGVLLAGACVTGLYASHIDAKVQIEKIKAGLELKVGDYNGNNILDKFYEIEGKKVPVEVDGKPVEEYFK